MISFPKTDPIHTYRHTLRSRYSETDKMGYVYYGRYLEYFEEARTEMIRSMGFAYSRLEKEGVLLPVTEAALDYHTPVHYDEPMMIDVLIYQRPTVRLITWYRLFTERRKDPHVTGRVSLVFVDAESRRPIRPPASFISPFDS